MRCCARRPASWPSTTAACPGAASIRRHANWVDDGAYELGVASYALVVRRGGAGLRHAHLAAACPLRPPDVEEAGVRRIAGGAEPLAPRPRRRQRGVRRLRDHRPCPDEAAAARAPAAIEAGTHAGPPAIDPLVLPTTTYEGMLRARGGRHPGRVAPCRHPQR